MLLRESEVAERLRCSTSKVKRLRLNGKLAYIPGKPVLVDEDDLSAYLESVKCRSRHPTSKNLTPASGTSIGHKTVSESASQRAKRIWLQRKNS